MHSMPTIDTKTMGRLVSTLARITSSNQLLDVETAFRRFRNIRCVWTSVHGTMQVGLTPFRRSDDSDDHEMRLAELRDLKDSRVTLRNILEVIDERIRLIQETCVPMAIQRGVRSLPEDVLRHIFELGHDRVEQSFPALEFIFSVSQVCRRFRSVALTTPGLWATLGNLLPPHQLETFLSRSGVVDLKLLLHIPEYESDGPCSAATFLKITSKHCHRWSHFSYSGGRRLHGIREYNDDVEDDGIDNDQIWFGYSHPAFSDYYDLRLPRLTHLSWNKVDYISTSDNLDLPKPFSNWDMPNLVHFEGHDTVINESVVGPDFKSCKLSFGRGVDEDLSLSNSLVAIQHVISLHFDLSYLKINPARNQTPSIISFENLQSFHLCLTKRVDKQSALVFLQALNMPILLHMSVVFGCKIGSGDAQCILTQIVSNAKRCPMLESFAICAPTMQMDELMSLAYILPPLKEISISGSGLCPHKFGHTLKDHPSWRVLRVDASAFSHYGGVLNLVKFMKESGECWETFRLHITGWQIPDELKRLLGDKLQYYN